MSVFASLSKVWTAVSETQHAVDVARTSIEQGDSPMATLRAIAEASENRLDDRAVAELEAVMRKAIVYLELGTRAAVTVSTALADPRVRKGLDTAVNGVIDSAYTFGRWRNTLALWLKEDP